VPDARNPGSLPIDRLTKNLSFIQAGLIQTDFEEIVKALSVVSEAVFEDAETLAEEMAEAGELYTAREIDDFRARFVGEKSK